jgi:hypothetical protein
LDNQ